MILRTHPTSSMFVLLIAALGDNVQGAQHSSVHLCPTSKHDATLMSWIALQQPASHP